MALAQAEAPSLGLEALPDGQGGVDVARSGRAKRPPVPVRTPNCVLNPSRHRPPPADSSSRIAGSTGAVRPFAERRKNPMAWPNLPLLLGITAFCICMTYSGRVYRGGTQKTPEGGTHLPMLESMLTAGTLVCRAPPHARHGRAVLTIACTSRRAAWLRGCTDLHVRARGTR